VECNMRPVGMSDGPHHGGTTNGRGGGLRPGTHGGTRQLGRSSDLEGRAGTRTIRISSGIENRAATASAGTVRRVSLAVKKTTRTGAFLKL
jgi:hypothetical protein